MWLLQRLKGCQSQTLCSHTPRRRCVYGNGDGGAKSMKAELLHPDKIANKRVAPPNHPVLPHKRLLSGGGKQIRSPFPLLLVGSILRRAEHSPPRVTPHMTETGFWQVILKPGVHHTRWPRGRPAQRLYSCSISR